MDSDEPILTKGEVDEILEIADRYYAYAGDGQRFTLGRKDKENLRAELMKYKDYFASAIDRLNKDLNGRVD